MVSEGSLMVLTGVAGGVTWLAITIIHGVGFVPQLVALSTMTLEVFLGLLTIHRKV